MSKRTSVIFFLKLSCTQSTEDVESEISRYCSQNNLSIVRFFNTKEVSGTPDNSYIFYALSGISRECCMYPDVILYIDFELPCLNDFPIIKDSLINRALTIQHWNFEGKNR